MRWRVGRGNGFSRLRVRDRVVVQGHSGAGVLSDPLDLTRWWPEVYLRVTKDEAASPDGSRAVYQLHTKGFLPYTLTWSFRIKDVERPSRIAIEAFGDLAGEGVWQLTEVGDEVRVVYDWRIRAEKPLLRYLSFVLKPFFAANHRWAMARGREGLERELNRLRAQGQ